MLELPRMTTQRTISESVMSTGDRHMAGLAARVIESMLREFPDVAARRGHEVVWPSLVIWGQLVPDKDGRRVLDTQLTTMLQTAPREGLATAYSQAFAPGWDSERREGQRREQGLYTQLDAANKTAERSANQLATLEERNRQALDLLRQLWAHGGAGRPQMRQLQAILTGEVLDGETPDDESPSQEANTWRG